MNPYLKNLNRIEFPVTYACSGRCKHCSEGDHAGAGECIDADAAARAIRQICKQYTIDSLMTFGGEPFLYPEVTCRIHETARRMGIPERQLITNGYFSRDPERIREVARRLAESGVTDILLSADAFHQETIPIAPVMLFAGAVLGEACLSIRLNPAYLVSEEDNNPYNLRTRQIIDEFRKMGIACASGNVIFPSGNALKYLGEYFEGIKLPENPYVEDPYDIRAISISPNGDTSIGGNVYRTDILTVMETYLPQPERGAGVRENTRAQMRTREAGICPCCGMPYRESADDVSERDGISAEPSAGGAEIPKTAWYRICAKCFWENDPVQLRDPDFAGGANSVSLNEARENVRRFGVCEERFIKTPRAAEDESQAAYRPRNNPR